MQNKGRYDCDRAIKHSDSLALKSRIANTESYNSAKGAISALGVVLDDIEKEKKSHAKNVKMALAARFYNHSFSQLMLIERGLFLDAVNSSRSATETIAF